ncbi:Helix-turn-helix domain-containing protein [Amycolatopsis arida]|uniref:Helix-turn-helix domain-containing protein n=1 Tax=Amycolatopsis arida TaxID=587909 RepID=A0A1I5PFI1_9PSEU|nr:helix-turn-helix transcriptional regulator [Amycolatopsis arida]TDX98479.1 helix-turn-helix protein [Amycolatopsis arida]SFP32753.1 Helix-turn-helix domain-containing protein [Amycolatopsis arida]
MPSSPTVASWELGSRLRAKRELLGLRSSVVVKNLGMSVQFLSAVEHGKKKLPMDKLDALIRVYEVDADEAVELRALREAAGLRGWWSQFSALFSEELLRMFGLEHGAESVRAFDNGLMNGLLQTEDYARAIIEAGSPNVRLAEVDRRVRARMIRQRRLTGEEPLQLTAVMSESTIHQQVGGPAVLADQLRHLLDLVDTHADTLDLRIVPFTATGHHAMGGSSFNLMTFPSSFLGTLVWQETVTSTELIEDDLTVREYSLAYAEVCKSALSQQESVDLIRQAAKKLE